jgi:hypothetical protein
MNLNYGTNGNGFLCASLWSPCLCGDKSVSSPQRHRDTKMHREDLFSRVTLGSIRNFLLRKEEVVGLLNRLEFKVRLLLVFH